MEGSATRVCPRVAFPVNSASMPEGVERIVVNRILEVSSRKLPYSSGSSHPKYG